MRCPWPAVLLLLLFTGPAAEAAEGCSFAVSGTTWTLEADCTTDASIVVPDGFTLDGAHHTILALDPAAGAFRGGIIVSGGATATVVNTVVSALRLANVCQSGDDRLRGIYFDHASGLVRGNTIVNVNKGASACQEGNAIEVRNADLDGPPTRVEIDGNLVDAFQKTGIVVSGNVEAAIHENSIGPSATQPLLAANGVQIGAGARAAIDFNIIAGNTWDGDEVAATAILLVNSAPGTRVRGNVIIGNADVGIYVMASGVRVEHNRLTDSGADGAFDVGIGNYGEGNVFDGNTITGFGTRYDNVPQPAGTDTTVARR